MRKVTFLGVAASVLEKEQLADEIPADAEIWVVNEAHRGLPDGRQPDRVFQLHVRHWRETERSYLNDAWTARGSSAVESWSTAYAAPLPAGFDWGCFGRNNDHVEYLRTCGVPVYGQRKWEDIPTSVRYPFEVVTESVGIPLPPHGNKRLWATSSFGYMAALLLHEHLTDLTERDPCRCCQMWAEEIDQNHLRIKRVKRRITAEDGCRCPSRDIASLQLIGIELPLGTTRERLWEWPNFAYYLGLMTGLGIEIILPSCGTSLLSAPHYALDGHPYPGEPDHWWSPGYAGIGIDGEGANQVYRLGKYMPHVEEPA